MSAIYDAIEKRLPKRFDGKIPGPVAAKCERAHARMRKDAPIRRVCQKFFEGDHYWYVNAQGMLSFLPSALIDPGKPDHRVRNKYNFVASIVEGKVSAASQRVPGYEIDPSSGDWDDYQAARISQQVAFYGYDKWRVRRATTKAITNALVQREGFILPYFDKNVGPFIRDSSGEYIGMGEIKLLNLNRSEVGWEPGVDFEDSRYYTIERATLKEEVKLLPGFTKVDLEHDASTEDSPVAAKSSDEMILVTQYFERPCPDYPEGRHIYMAAKQVIVDHRNDPDCPPDWDHWWAPYPVRTPEGDVADEPCLHRISYTVNPEGDDLGLVERIIDLQRTINDCWNKLLEWKNRCLFPQLLTPMGSKVGARSDVPGANIPYNPSVGFKPEWEKVPEVPRALFDMLMQSIEHMRALAADIDVQPDPDLAAKTANAAIETSRARWQSFLGDLAEFHSRLMRHCLTLVQLHYGEKRIIQVRGMYGSEPPISFTGRDLMSQVNVRVLPGSIESRSRQQTMNEIAFINEIAPGSVSPEAVLGVVHGGPAENLIKSYQLDMDRAWKLCMSLKEGPQAMLAWTPRFDPVLGTPDTDPPYVVPGWLPRKMDNIAVWKQVVADFCKTAEFDRYPMETQQAFYSVYDTLEFAEQQRMTMIAMQGQGMAQQLGAQNAAAPQPTPPMETGKPISPQQAAPAAQTPEQ